MTRRREKAGYTWVIIDTIETQLPTPVAQKWLRMEMALTKIVSLDFAGMPKSNGRVAQMLAEEALAGRQT